MTDGVCTDVEATIRPQEARIIEATYPQFGVFAVELHRKLNGEVERSSEPIEFGPTALDIGSRDGRYTPVIREMGATSVVAIDPSVRELRSGVSRGVLKPDEVFGGTLEDWVANGADPVDCAYVLNMNPNLSHSPRFFSALMSAVKPGGLIVTSFVEFSTCRRFGISMGFSDLTRSVERKRVAAERGPSAIQEKRLRDHLSQVNGWLSLSVRLSDDRE